MAIPPRRLRARAGAPGAVEFVQGGREAARTLVDTLERAGRPGEGPLAVLDLGCGSGRVLPHVAALLVNAVCTGCDVDPAAIEWASAHHPAQTWRATLFRPPLPLPQSSFQVAYSISVFSHLDAELGDQWLTEVARLLGEGGLALLSVHGAHAFEAFRRGEVTSSWIRPDAFAREPLDAEEFVFEPYVRTRWNTSELPGVEDGYGLAFHGEARLRRLFGRELEVVEILPRAMADWQDLVVCRKRPSSR